MRSSYLPLTIKQLSVSFAKKTSIKALDHIDLTLRSQGISVIMGPNGSGKTVLLKCISQLIEHEGIVEWGSKNSSQPKAPQITWVPQKAVLLKRSVYDNILLPLKHNQYKDAESRCHEALKWAGIDSIVDKQAQTLSTGEQQLTALARAWALEPQILLLDEPTANLDPERYQIMNTLIQQMSPKCKVILSSHSRRQAQELAEDLLLLNKGKLQYYTDAQDYFSNNASN